MKRLILPPCAALALAGLIKCAPQPPLVINETPSVPPGLYVRSPGAEPMLGRLVTLAQPATARAYLTGLGVPPDMRLLKRVAAVGGEPVCARRGRLRTPRQEVAAPRHDRRGVPLPVWDECRRLRADEVLLLGDTPTSFDSRYFGPVRRADLEGAYTEVLTW
jgi:type IV secretory pathway protease TraF